MVRQPLSAFPVEAVGQHLVPPREVPGPLAPLPAWIQELTALTRPAARRRRLGGRDPVQLGQVRIGEPGPHIRRGQQRLEHVSQRDLPLGHLSCPGAVTSAER